MVFFFLFFWWTKLTAKCTFFNNKQQNRSEKKEGDTKKAAEKKKTDARKSAEDLKKDIKARILSVEGGEKVDFSDVDMSLDGDAFTGKSIVKYPFMFISPRKNSQVWIHTWIYAALERWGGAERTTEREGQKGRATESGGRQERATEHQWQPFG